MPTQIRKYRSKMMFWKNTLTSFHQMTLALQWVFSILSFHSFFLIDL